METPTWFFALQAIANTAIVATFFVYYRQMKFMQGQLEASRHASAGQNVLGLLPFLQDPRVSEARGVLINLKGKAPNLWTDAEKESARSACAAYDIAGILIRSGIVPKDIIMNNWSDSITKCHVAATEYLKEVRQSRGTDYWDNFEWLAEQISARRV